MNSCLQVGDLSQLQEHDSIVLLLNVDNSGLEDDFRFESAMRLLPLRVQAAVLRKKFRADQVKTLCNRLLQLFGCLVLTGLENRKELTFTSGKFGKPRLDSSRHITFSMSNGESYVCMYVSKDARVDNVGIDIASVKNLQNKEELELYKDIFTEQEYEILFSCPTETVKRLFAHYWSLKESYTKYLGTGLNIDLKQVDIGSIYMNQLETMAHINGRSVQFQSFWIQPTGEEIISVCHEKLENETSDSSPPPVIYEISFNQLWKFLESHS